MRSALTAVCVALLVAACGGGNTTSPLAESADQMHTVSADLADGYTVETKIPEAWARFTTGGLVVARLGSDMDLDVMPQGPRIVVGVDHDILDVASERLVDDETAADFGEVIDDPQELTVGGQPAVSITIRLGSTTAHFVAVSVGGTSHLVTAEAPASSWLDDQPIIDQIIGSIRLQQSATATTTTARPSAEATTSEPDSTTTTTTSTTATTATTTTPVVRFSSPEAAILDYFAIEAAEFLDCNSGAPGWAEPCFDFQFERVDTPEGEHHFVYTFRTRAEIVGDEVEPPVWWWVLVKRSATGEHEVLDVVLFEEATFDSPFSYRYE